MSDPPNKAGKRLIKWRDSARRQLSTASCSDDLASALQFVLRNAGKTFRAVLHSPDDDRLSRDLNDVLCHVSSHLYLRSRSLLADRCSDRFDYWAHQCAVLSYLLDLSLVRDEPGAFTKICFVLAKNKHAIWDVLVQTSAISSASEPQSKLVDLFRRLAAYCPRTCASAELYFKFVVCAACLARRLPERGWKTVKPVVLSIEPAEFDFEEWFSSQPALVSLLPRSEVPMCRRKVIARLCKSALDPAELLEACRTLGESGGGIRTACDAAAASEVDMFLIADEEVPEREQDAKTAEVEDEQLQAILDATLSRLQSNIATPAQVMPSPTLRSSVSAGDTGVEVLKNAESPTKKLGSGQQKLVEGVNNDEENEVVTATLPKGYEYASVAQEMSEGEGGAENCVDGTTAASRPRKKRRKRKRARKARALSKLHGTAEVNDKLTTSKTAKESDASAVSTDDEVQQKTRMSSQGNALHRSAHGLCSISTAQDSDALAMLHGSRHGVKKTKQDSVNKPKEKSCKHSDAEVDDEVSLNSIEGPPYPSNSQEEPVGIVVKEALSRCYRTGKATLPVDAGGSLSSSRSKEESTAEPGLLQARQTQKLTTRRRFRVTESSAEESHSEQELSSDSDVLNLNATRTLNGDQCEVRVTESDDPSDREELLRGHCDSKTNAEMLSTMGREKSSGQTDDSTETFPSSSDDEVQKTSGQAMSGNAAEAISSVSDAEVVQNGGQNLREDAAVTLSKSNSDLPLAPVEAGDVATVSIMKKAHRRRIVVSSESSDQEHRAKHWAFEADSARAVKKARRNRTFISSESSDEDHSAQHLPLQKAESTVEEGVEDLEQDAESSDKESSVERSAPQEVKSSEKRRVEHSAQRDYKLARTVKNAHRSRTFISCKSSDEDHSVEHSPLHEAESSDEEGIVDHSAQKTEFSDQECSSEHSAPREAESPKKRCIEHSAQREVKPGRTVKKARRSRTFISSESSDGDHIVEHSPLNKAEFSDEEDSVDKSAPQEPKSAEKHFFEHSQQREDEPVRTFQQARRSRALISSESSGEDHRVDHSPLQKAESSDEEGIVIHSAQREDQPATTVKKTRRSKTLISLESSEEYGSVEHLPLRAESSNEEGSVEHSAQRKVKPARTVQKARRSKTLISSESSDEDGSVEHLPLQAEFSDEEGSVEQSAQKSESSNEEGCIEHSAQGEVKPARTVQKARRSKTLISSESSDEDESVEHLPLQKAMSSDEESTVDHSLQKPEFSNQEGSAEHSAPQKANSFEKRCIERTEQQEVKPARTVKKAHRSKTVISSESSDEDRSAEHSLLHNSESSDEGSGVERSVPQKAESSDRGDCCETPSATN
ncbi:hypothetical protein MTO96_004899 [Rhipicephalus appendiculatus]